MVERGTGPKSLMEWSKGCPDLGYCLAVCVMCCVYVKLISLHGESYPPSYRPRGSRGFTDGRKRKKPKVEVPLRRC